MTLPAGVLIPTQPIHVQDGNVRKAKPIPKELADSAAVVLVNFSIAGSVVTQPRIVEVEDNGTKTYWVLVKAQVKISRGNSNVFLLARKFTEKPTSNYTAPAVFKRDTQNNPIGITLEGKDYRIVSE